MLRISRGYTRAALVLALVCALSTDGVTQTPGQAVKPDANRPAGHGIIAGVVLDAETNEPLGGAIVTLTTNPPDPNSGDRRATDDRGRFAFTAVFSGEYIVNVRAFGHLDGGIGRTDSGANSVSAPSIALADGGVAGPLTIRLSRPGAVEGTVFDESGEPIVNAPVNALRRLYVAGELHTVLAHATRTDDRGQYRLANLTPARYLVVVPVAHHTRPSGAKLSQAAVGMVSAHPAANLAIGDTTRLVVGDLPPPPVNANGRAQTYDSTYFPSALTLDNAEAVDVGAGAARVGIDIRLRPVTAVRVSGRVDAPADISADLTLRLRRADTDDTDVATALTGNDRLFSFADVPSGQYTIVAGPSTSAYTLGPTPLLGWSGAVFAGASRASVPGVGGLRRLSWMTDGDDLVGRAGIDVQDQDLRGVVLRVSHEITVNGHIVIEQHGTGVARALSDSMTVVAEPADGDPSMGDAGMRTRPGDASRSFAFGGLGPGRFWLRVLSDVFVMKSVEWNGHDYATAPLEIATGGDVSGVTITLTDQAATISGSVRDANGAPRAQSVVICFPADPTLWKDYGLRPDRLRSVPVAASGGYSVPRLPAGDYAVVAVGARQAEAWTDPAWLAQQARVASRVKVGWGESVVQNLVLQTAIGGGS